MILTKNDERDISIYMPEIGGEGEGNNNIEINDLTNKR